MRRLGIAIAVVVCTLQYLSLSGQTPQSAASSASQILQNSYAALSGTTALNDATLTGSAEWIAGSDDETGTVTYKAVGAASRLDLNFASGTRSEIRGSEANSPTGAWVGADGASHPMTNHNLLTDPGWFPPFALGNLISSSSTALTYVGVETRNGEQVIHLTASQQPPTSADQGASLLQHLSQMDIYLSSTTLLPASIVFNSHPDDNALVDIPTEIRYANYKTFGSAQIPMHVQRYINNVLALDLQFQSAVLNSGLSTTLFAIQ